MPCILIELDQVQNLSNQFQYRYEVIFSINLLIKDESILYVQKIGDKIIDIIKPINFNLDSFEVAGIKYNEIKILYSKDMITTKFSIFYRALIKQGII